MHRTPLPPSPLTGAGLWRALRRASALVVGAAALVACEQAAEVTAPVAAPSLALAGAGGVDPLMAAVAAAGASCTSQPNLGAARVAGPGYLTTGASGAMAALAAPILDAGPTPGGGTATAVDVNDGGLAVINVSSGGAPGVYLWTASGGYTGAPIPALAGATSMTATDVNNAGVVVGIATTASGFKSWRYQGGSTVEIAGPANLQVRAINDAGQMTGSIGATGATQAVRFVGGSWETLAAAPSSGWAINAGGTVAGWTGNGAAQRAVVWAASLPAGSPGQTLPAAPGASSSRAYAINDGGAVVGTGLTGPTSTRAFYWSAGTGMIEIIGTGFSVPAVALDINNAGLVAGYAVSIEGGSHAFLWKAPGGPITDLGKLAGACSSFGWGINDVCDVIGVNVGTPTGDRAALWQTGCGNTPPAPSIVATGAGTCSADASVTFTFTDAEGNGPFGYVIAWGDGTTSTGSGMPGAPITVSHQYATNGTFNASVTVTDGSGASTTTPTVQLVRNCQNPPTPTIVAKADGSCSALPTVTFSVADPDGAAGGPWSYTIAWGDGTTSTGTTSSLGTPITATKAAQYATAGSYTVTVTVTDGTSLSAATTTTVSYADCNQPPVPTIKLDVDGTCLTKPIVLFKVSDADGASDGPWSYTIAWGDGTTSTGTTTSRDAFVTVVKAAQYATIGTYEVTVTVTDKRGAVGTVSTSVKFDCGKKAPEPKYITVDAKCSALPTVSFKVYDADGVLTGPWTYTVEWGDGTTSTGTTSKLMEYITVTKPATYDENGTYTVTVTVTDRVGRSSAESVSLKSGCIKPNTPPKVKYFTVDASCKSLPSVAFKVYDEDGAASGPWSYTVTWGDGTTSTGTTTKQMEYITVTKAAAYAENRTYTVTVTITDKAGASDSESVAVKSSCVKENEPPKVKYVEIETKCSKLPVVTFKVYDEDGTASGPWTYTVAWGDGTTSTGTTTKQMEYITVTKAAAYPENKTYTVTVTVTDKAGASDSEKVSASYTCVPKNEPPMVKYLSVDASCKKLPAVSFKVYDEDGAGSGPWTYTITWGDGTTSTGTTTKQMEYITVSKAAAYTTNKTYTVTVTITDKGGRSASDSESVSYGCAKQLPVPKLVIVTPNVQCKADAKVTASFTDPDGTAKPWTWTIEWGDGAKSTGKSNTTGNVPGTETHEYTKAGTYTVTFTVTNDDGDRAATTGTVTVACGATPPPSGGSCTRTQGYWKNHESEWPKPFSPNADFMRSGSKSVTWDQLMGMAPSGGNSYVQLAHQWMAATLNVANGVKADDDVMKTLVASGAWLLVKTGHDGSIPHVKDATATAWAEYLDKFNNGQLGNPHCK